MPELSQETDRDSLTLSLDVRFDQGWMDDSADKDSWLVMDAVIARLKTPQDGFVYEVPQYFAMLPSGRSFVKRFTEWTIRVETRQREHDVPYGHESQRKWSKDRLDALQKIFSSIDCEYPYAISEHRLRFPSVPADELYPHIEKYENNLFDQMEQWKLSEEGIESLKEIDDETKQWEVIISVHARRQHKATQNLKPY